MIATEKDQFEFWVKMFRPRAEKYRRATLKKLKAGVSIFETVQQNADKIKALEYLRDGFVNLGKQ